MVVNSFTGRGREGARGQFKGKRKTMQRKKIIPGKCSFMGGVLWGVIVVVNFHWEGAVRSYRTVRRGMKKKYRERKLNYGNVRL